MMATLVTAGAVAIALDHLRVFGNGNVEFVPLADENMEICAGAVWKRSKETGAITSFVDFLEQACEGFGKEDFLARSGPEDVYKRQGTNDATTRMATAMTMPSPLLFTNPSLLKNFVNASCAICLSSLKKERGRSPVSYRAWRLLPLGAAASWYTGSHPPTSRRRAPFDLSLIHIFNRFWNSPSGMMNYFLFAGKGVNPPGEVRSKDWVWMELARRLGFADKYCPKMLDVTDWHDWDDQVIERIYKPAYEKWAEDENGLLGYYEIEPPSWEEFQKLPIVRVPGEPGEWFYPFKNTVEWGRSPFKTPSGKIEFCLLYTSRCV